MRQYPVITASEPLRERYRSPGSFGTRSSAYASPSVRSPATEYPPATNKGKQRSRGHGRDSQPQLEPQPEAVVPIKKKKKPRKVVKHTEPDPGELSLNKGPPAPAETAQVGGHDGHESPKNEESRAWSDDRNQQETHAASNYQSDYGIDQDEFRNVWGRDQESR